MATKKTTPVSVPAVRRPRKAAAALPPGIPPALIEAAASTLKTLQAQLVVAQQVVDALKQAVEASRAR